MFLCNYMKSLYFTWELESGGANTSRQPKEVAPTLRQLHWLVVVSRYTEIANRYPIFSNTDTDTDVGILNTGTENTEIPTSDTGSNIFAIKGVVIFPIYPITVFQNSVDRR